MQSRSILPMRFILLSSAVVAILHREIVRAFADASVRSRIQALGADVVGGSPDEFAAHIRGEVGKWAKLAKETGLRAD